MPTSSPIVLATSNRHKAGELQSSFDAAHLPYHVLTLADIGYTDQIDETGLTFEENAYIKAVMVHQATGLTVLADDSGLEVDVLDGLPGVRSARFAGEHADDAANRMKLQTELRKRHTAVSAARFRCTLCWIDTTRTLLTEGVSVGTVILDERGSQGFGYDSMFIPAGSTRPYAEMDASEKQLTSHRSRAMTALIQQIAGHEEHPPSKSSRDARSAMIDVALCIVGAPDRLEQCLDRVSSDVHHELYEIVLQSYLFCGFPAALDALQACYRMFGAPPSLGEVGIISPEAELFTRGEALCREIYGNVYDKMMDTLQRVSPDLARWMIVEGYGKTLARPGADIVTRELCNVAMLTMLGRQQQLTSHVRGALRVGATLDDLRQIEHSITELFGVHVASRLSGHILLQEGRLADQRG